MNKGKLEANIARLRESQTEHLSKADEADKQTEKDHYMMLADLNQAAITEYEQQLQEE